MKKIYILLAAMVAFVGCSVEDDAASAPKSKFSLNANIESPRVSVTGDKYTEVNWEAGDAVQLVSEAGVSATLYAESAGKSTRFSGEGEMKAEVDTYYAVYGNSNNYTLSGSVVTLNYATQSGGDDGASALLVGMAKDVGPYGISMPFTPANSLLHVAVSGVSKISKAELFALDGSSFATAYSYNIATDEVQHTATGSTITVTNPAASGFFFALPADLAMPNFVVRLTDGSGNTCVKAFAAKTFEKGSTVRINFTWATPEVTLGVKSSYSYYAAGDGASANKVAATKIYFSTGVNGESCASTYTDVQDAVIEDVGFEVEGVEYSYQAGQVTWDKAANSFVIDSSLSPAYSTDWGEKTNIKAYVKAFGKKIYSTNNVWITGLPYDYSFVNGSLDAYRSAGWTTNGSLRVSNETLAGRAKTLVLNHRRYVWIFANEHEKGFVVSPKFMLPANISVQPSIAHSSYNVGGDLTRTTFVGAVSNTSSSNQSAVRFTSTAGSSTGGTVYGVDEWQSAFTLSASAPYISIDCDDVTANNTGTYYFLHEAHFRYEQ